MAPGGHTRPSLTDAGVAFERARAAIERTWEVRAAAAEGRLCTQELRVDVHRVRRASLDARARAAALMGIYDIDTPIVQ